MRDIVFVLEKKVVNQNVPRLSKNVEHLNRVSSYAQRKGLNPSQAEPLLRFWCIDRFAQHQFHPANKEPYVAAIAAIAQRSIWRIIRPSGVSVRVLVIEDENNNRETLCDVLRLLGHTPFAAESAAQALAMVPKTKPELIVSDIDLPDMDGRELIKQILSQSNERLYTVALTGYQGDLERDLAFKAGFQSFLAKPVTLETVRATIESLHHSAPLLLNRAEVSP